MSSPIIALSQVTVDFDGFKALTDLNFSMEKGETRVVIGPNGAGKTTLLDVITGKTTPQIGTVLFDGTTDLLGRRENEIAGLGIGRKFQTPTVFPHHSVFENMELALRQNRSVWSVLRARLDSEATDKIHSTLNTVGLSTEKHRMAGSLSHGQKQWLEIGMLLSQDPQLILLDEPVAGMTGKERQQTAQLIHTISGNHSIMVIEHDMEFVRQISKKVTVLHGGTVLCEGSLQDVQNDPTVIDVYLGRADEGDPIAAN